MPRVSQSVMSTVATMAALALPASAPAAWPGVLTGDGGRFVVKPASIAYTGDSTGFVGGVDGTGWAHPGRLRWTAYGPRQGRATGVVWLDDCEPSCAAGTFTAHPVKVHVFAPRSGRFTRLTLQYAYAGQAVVNRRALHRTRSSWSYAILGSA